MYSAGPLEAAQSNSYSKNPHAELGAEPADPLFWRISPLLTAQTPRVEQFDCLLYSPATELSQNRSLHLSLILSPFAPRTAFLWDACPTGSWFQSLIKCTCMNATMQMRLSEEPGGSGRGLISARPSEEEMFFTQSSV